MPTPIEIFKPGRHIDSHGKVVEFSDADCAACAAAYDPAVHEAPIVIGHPTQDAPAYGWVKSLAFAERRMSAGADQLDPAFAEAVGAGHYKKVSASFYTPTSPSNPKPGAYYLRHVGFLGAAPPAVKGLRQVSFAAGDEDSVTVEFGDYAVRDIATAFRSLRDWLLGKFGQEDADKALPSWSVDAVQVAAVEATAVAVSSTGFSEGAESVASEPPNDGVTPAPGSPDASQSSTQVPVELAPPPAPSVEDTPPAAPAPATPSPSETLVDPREAELVRREAELKRGEAELEKKRLEAQHASHVSYLEGLVKEGRPLPCSQDTMVNFMRLLDGETTDVVSFGEAESRTPLELFKAELLANLPKEVNFGELAPTGSELPSDDPEVVAKEAIAFQGDQRAKGVFISTSEAVAHVKGAV